MDVVLLLFLIGVGIFAERWWLALILAWPIGLVQFALGEALAHEASHYNLFSSRRANNAAEWFYAIPFFFYYS